MKRTKTKSALAFLMLTAVIAGWSVIPVTASTPTYDSTGIWKTANGETFQLFQEKDEVHGIYVNSGFVHRFQGRYVSPTKIKFIQLRRTRSNNCEVTMDGEITLSSANSMSIISYPSETGCGISIGQTYPNIWTRAL